MLGRQKNLKKPLLTYITVWKEFMEKVELSLSLQVVDWRLVGTWKSEEEKLLSKGRNLGPSGEWTGSRCVEGTWEKTNG